MHHDVLDIIKNVNYLYENNSSLAALKDFERVLDEMDMYVYDNWIDGELAYGPKIDRHWITAGFMWPHKNMPDPTGGKRLTDIGCKVKYQKSHLIEPREIKTPEDIRPGTKKGRLDRKPIWIVEIQMPKKVAFDMYKGYMEKMKNENNYGGSKPQEAAPAPVAAPMAAPMAAPVGPGATPAPIAPGAPQPGI